MANLHPENVRRTGGYEIMKTRALLVVIFMTFAMIPTFVDAQPLGFVWSCDVIDDNPDSFLLDAQVWNSTAWEWDPPIWYQLYWNGTYLVPPPVEYQVGSFNFTVTTGHNATKVVAVYGGNYTGPPNDYDWISTNGIILATDGPYNHPEPLNGLLNASLWEGTGWCKIQVFGSYYDPYYDSAVAFGEIHFFYMNSSLDIELPFSPPSQELEVVQMIVEIIVLPIRVFNEVIARLLNSLKSLILF